MKKKHIEVREMELIQIGVPQSQPAQSIRQLFEEMAQREAEMVRNARERIGSQRRTARERSNAQ